MPSSSTVSLEAQVLSALTSSSGGFHALEGFSFCKPFHALFVVNWLALFEGNKAIIKALHSCKQYSSLLCDILHNGAREW